MADVRPIILSGGLQKEMTSGENMPVSNMAVGGLLPLTSCYRFPVGFTWIMEDETNNGTYVRIKFDNGVLDQVPCDINGDPL